MAAKFSKGDVVQLISGGPPMIIVPKDGYGATNTPPVYSDSVNCIWFDTLGVCHEREFPLNILQ